MKLSNSLQTLAAAALVGLIGAPAQGVTLNPTGDTYSTITYNTAKPPVVIKTAVSSATGALGSLEVSKSHTAFVQFNAATLLSGAMVTGARLTIYFPSVTKAGELGLQLVTSPWEEKFAGGVVQQPMANAPFFTIPAASVVAKQFVVVDVTAEVQAWVSGATKDYGFAISSPDEVVNALIGAKEGPGSGYPCTLDVDLDVVDTGTVNTNSLSVSSAFVVQSVPNNNPAAGFPNTFIGAGAGAANTTGSADIFIGTNSGTANTTGGNNVGLGFECGARNTTGTDNSFVGAYAGEVNTTGSFNTFTGAGAGQGNTTGADNSFFGLLAGPVNTNGSDSSFFGYEAGFQNTASGSSFFGSGAGYSNTSATGNAFFGCNAGYMNTAGANSFFGSGAGQSNTTGQQNSLFGINAGNPGTLNAGAVLTGSHDSFFGCGAGQNVTLGDDNTLMGNVAGYNLTTGFHNTAIGGDSGQSLTVESQNTFLGAESNGAAGVSNSTAIGANAQVTASNSVVLGSIAGVNSATQSCNVGIGVTAPNSTLQVAGSISLPVRTVNNSILTTWSSTDYVIVLTGATATNAGLPAPPIAGRICVLKNLSSKTAIVEPITGNATVDGGSSVSVVAGAAGQFISDGTSWYKIN